MFVQAAKESMLLVRDAMGTKLHEAHARLLEKQRECADLRQQLRVRMLTYADVC